MLCPSVFPPPPPALRPPPALCWPVRSLWPDARLFQQLEQQMLRHMQEVRQSMDFMERLHQRIFQEIDLPSCSAAVFRPVACRDLGRDGGFALSLDTQDFAPEELSVKQVGRKLRVSGRTEKRTEDEKGSYSYRCEEFRQELELPDGVDPETVTCSLLGGRLQIQAPRERAPGDGKERLVPISVTSAPAVTSCSGGAEASGPSPAEKN